tara:strand:+ start:100309 stop:100788 length:480 start_codon:yes stop_codon:yes gene_type:complete
MSRKPNGRDRHDRLTGDLFDYSPENEARLPSFAPEQIRAASIGAKISKAVAATLSESDLKRPEIATRMSEYLGQNVAKGTLDGYSSGAREDNKISLERALALCQATGDPRLLIMIVEELSLAVIEERFLPAALEAMAQAQIEDLQQQVKTYRARWRAAK